MNFHEYQAKELFASYGVTVPAGAVAWTPDEAAVVAQNMGGHKWVVKAQVHAGGRGKAGGVKLVHSLDGVRAETKRMLNLKISTYQTGGLALPVNSVLIAAATEINNVSTIADSHMPFASKRPVTNGRLAVRFICASRSRS